MLLCSLGLGLRPPCLPWLLPAGPEPWSPGGTTLHLVTLTTRSSTVECHRVQKGSVDEGHPRVLLHDGQEQEEHLVTEGVQPWGQGGYT